jgi:hypothetical protein
MPAWILPHLDNRLHRLDYYFIRAGIAAFYGIIHVDDEFMMYVLPLLVSNSDGQLESGLAKDVINGGKSEKGI